MGEFAFDLVDRGAGLGVTIGVGGWLASPTDAAWKPWEAALSAPEAGDGGESVVLRWESDAQRRLGTALSSFLRDQARAPLF